MTRALNKVTVEATPPREEGNNLDYSDVPDAKTLHNSIIKGWLKSGNDMDRHLAQLDRDVTDESPVELKVVASKIFIVAYQARLKAVEVMAKLLESAEAAQSTGRELPEGLTIKELRALAKSMQG